MAKRFASRQGVELTDTFPRPRRARRGTYSIVAHDPATGALGVAVQSHWFSVGSLVTWAEAGVGAVATQANVDVSYGPRALAAMRGGASAAEALALLTAGDADFRQLGVVDARGGAAAHTGPECMTFAGHAVGDGFACQANLMAGDEVWPAMAAAYEAADGSLTRRLLAALDAGDAAGGDVRGRQSAAILIVPATGEPWDRIVELRVEDHRDPLGELRRLVGLHDAYVLAGEGDWLVGQGDHDAAAERYVQAYELAPDNAELRFWAGLSLVLMGDDDAGLDHVRAVIDQHAGWGELLGRLTPETAPAAEGVRARLGLG
jgi:uncharacterized Ntn-hydrolase superfamily protein